MSLFISIAPLILSIHSKMLLVTVYSPTPSPPSAELSPPSESDLISILSFFVRGLEGVFSFAGVFFFLLVLASGDLSSDSLTSLLASLSGDSAVLRFLGVAGALASPPVAALPRTTNLGQQAPRKAESAAYSCRKTGEARQLCASLEATFS